MPRVFPAEFRDFVSDACVHEAFGGASTCTATASVSVSVSAPVSGSDTGSVSVPVSASSREAIEDGADDVELRSDRFVDRFEIPKRLRDIETGSDFFRRPERDRIERLAIAPAHIAAL